MYTCIITNRGDFESKPEVSDEFFEALNKLESLLMLRSTTEFKQKQLSFSKNFLKFCLRISFLHNI